MPLLLLLAVVVVAVVGGVVAVVAVVGGVVVAVVVAMFESLRSKVATYQLLPEQPLLELATMLWFAPLSKIFYQQALLSKLVLLIKAI